jgi:hypothetical protein
VFCRFRITYELMKLMAERSGQATLLPSNVIIITLLDRFIIFAFRLVCALRDERIEQWITRFWTHSKRMLGTCD